MKRLKIDDNQINFIGAWKLDNDQISKDIIDFFEHNIDLQKDGSTGDGKNQNIKKTTDINVHPKNLNDEKFLVINGKVEFKFKHILKKKIFKILCNEKKMEIVNSIPGWIHSLKNIGKRKAQVFVWSNEVFNVKKPDTIFKKIK